MVQARMSLRKINSASKESGNIETEPTAILEKQQIPPPASN